MDLKVLRIYSSTIVRNDYPDPSHIKEQSSSTKCEEWAKPFALHHLIRDLKNNEAPSPLHDFKEMETKVKHIKSSGKMPSSMLCDRYSELSREAERFFLQNNKFDIVMCTCNEASGTRVKMMSPHQCIIDECGMAYEPETILPLRHCQHAVLIGDHKQLQPIIKYHSARKCGLSTSLLERYAENPCICLHVLDTQYRMVRQFFVKHLNDDVNVIMEVMTAKKLKIIHSADNYTHRR